MAAYGTAATAERIEVTWNGQRVVVVISPNTGTATGLTAVAYFAEDRATIIRNAAEQVERFGPPPDEPISLLPLRLLRPPWRPPALEVADLQVPRPTRGAQAKRAGVMLARRGCRGR